MTDEEATEAVRSALAGIFEDAIIGDFVVVASVYKNDGLSRIAVHVPEGTALHSQLGLLTSALNRASAIDIDGWTPDD